MKFKTRFLSVLLFTIGVVVNSSYAMKGYVPKELRGRCPGVINNTDPLINCITRTIAIGQRMQEIFDILTEIFNDGDYRRKAHAELEALSVELEEICTYVRAANRPMPTLPWDSCNPPLQELIEAGEPTSFWEIVKGLTLCLDNYRSRKLDIDVINAQEEWLLAHAINKNARGEWPRHGNRELSDLRPFSAMLSSSFTRLSLLVRARGYAADAIFTGKLYLLPQDKLASHINEYKVGLAAIMQRHVANIKRIMEAGPRGWDGPLLSFLMLSYEDRFKLESTVRIFEILDRILRFPFPAALREEIQALIGWGRSFLNLDADVARRLIFLAQQPSLYLSAGDGRYHVVMAEIGRLLSVLQNTGLHIRTDKAGEIRAAALEYYRLLNLFFQARQNIPAREITSLVQSGKLTQLFRSMCVIRDFLELFRKPESLVSQLRRLLMYPAKGQYFNSLLFRL